MNNIVLGLIMTAPFVFGFFLTDRLSQFLDENHRNTGSRHTHDKGA